MKNKCSDCESSIKASSLQIELNKANTYIYLLEQALDCSQALNQTLREDNESLRNRLKSYEF